MSSYFRSLLAEVLPGWAFWRSPRRPTAPLDGQPLGVRVEPTDVETNTAEHRKGAEPDDPRDDAQPPVDPDSENRRL